MKNHIKLRLRTWMLVVALLALLAAYQGERYRRFRMGYVSLDAVAYEYNANIAAKSQGVFRPLSGREIGTAAGIVCQEGSWGRDSAMRGQVMEHIQVGMVPRGSFIAVHLEPSPPPPNAIWTIPVQDLDFHSATVLKSIVQPFRAEVYGRMVFYMPSIDGATATGTSVEEFAIPAQGKAHDVQVTLPAE
ncbi:MAG: hypothetical protein U0795_03610 [Pirellulales bacterium]